MIDLTMRDYSSGRPITKRERLHFAALLCILFAICVVCASCAAFQHTATREQSAQAVYKIAVDVTEVPIVTDDDNADDAGTDVHVDRAPTLVDVTTTKDADGETHERWTGTAWVVQKAPGRSYLMTAGHVCESREVVDETDPIFGLPTGRKAQVTDVRYKLIAADGTIVTGAKVLLDDDDHDLCMLTVQGDLGDPIPVADHDPDYGEHGWYVGAPRGLWGGGIAGVYDVTFSGRGAPFKGDCGGWPACDDDSLVFSSAESAPGASGSPLIVGGRAVAVLNLGATGFGTFTSGVSWDLMRDFMARATHKLRK